MEIDGEQTKPHSPRSLRARKSSEGRPTEPQPKALTAKNEKTRAPGSAKSAKSTRKAAQPAAVAAAPHRTLASASGPTSASDPAFRSRIARSPHSDSSSADSVADGSLIQRDLSPLSAPATPATNFSTASTTQSSSARSAGKKAQPADEGSTVDALPAAAKERDRIGASASSIVRTASSTRKGKGRAVEPIHTSAKQTATASTRTPEFSASASKLSNPKKRVADPGSNANPSHRDAPKRQKQSTAGSSSYNLRSKTSPASGLSATGSSSKASTSEMAPRKGSGDFSLTRGGGGGGASQQGGGTGAGSAASGSPAAKGKGRARGGRNSRGKVFRDDLDCSAEGLGRSLDDGGRDDQDEEAIAPHGDDSRDNGDDDNDVKMEDAETSKRDLSKNSNMDDRKAQGDGKGENEGEDGDEGYDDGDGNDAEDEDRFDDEDDEDDEGPYGEAREDDGGGGAFGLNLRAMAGYMSGLTGRFRTLLASLKDSSDPTTQLVSLQELSELLSVSTEDTLAGYFPTEAFVKELIYIMGGPKPNDGRPSTAGNRSYDTDGDEEMVAAIAAAAAADFEEDSGEKMLLACRCLANLIEAMPYTAHSVVSHGAIPVLTSKLMEITFIDLAEQVLQTLEKISQEFPSAIVKEGGLTAILQYLDFFNIHIQRTAMTAAANCCRKLLIDSFLMVKDVMPTIQNVLTYSDQRLVESACKCVVRAVESYKHQPDLVEQLLTADLISALNELLLPAAASGASTGSGTGSKGGSNTTVGSNTYTDVLKALSTACRASPKVAVTLLENRIVEVLYHLLTGSPAPGEEAAEQQDGATSTGGIAQSDKVKATIAVDLESEGANAGGAEAAAIAVVSEAQGQGVVAVADMAVLQNLAQRPKEQVQEALSLIGELLPPLPKDGVFDARAYTEKAFLRRKAHEQKSRKKDKDPVAAVKDAVESGDKVATATSGSADCSDVSPSTSATSTSSSSSSVAAVATSSARLEKPRSEREAGKEAAQAARVEMLKSRKEIVQRFTQLVLPTLVEVYAASVAPHVRSKALNGILKVISFVEPEPLARALDKVPMAGFVAAVLSTRDHPYLVHGALQIVELLTIKLPHIYTSLLRREGVMWEIESIADQEPTQKRSSFKKAADGSGGGSGSGKKVGQTQAQTQPLALSLPSGGASSSTASVGSTVEEALASSGLARLLGPASSIEALSGLGSASVSSSRIQPSAQSLMDSADVNIWRARMLRSKFSEQAVSSEGAKHAVQALDRTKLLVDRLEGEAESESDEAVAKSTVDEITGLFLNSDEPISSFELLRSGLVESLYAFATKASSGGPPLDRRRSILIESLMRADPSGTTGASVLVRRLQESLSRLENVDITTALSGGNDDSRRSATSMLGRQLRLRLVAEDAAGEIPRSCTNIVVTIHAVATFQSLNDYLRPKIASAAAASSANGGTAASGGGSSSSSSRLSSVLAAFAAATGSGAFPDLSGRAATSTSAPSDSTAKAEASTAKEDGDGGAGASSSTSQKGSPRRSSRLNKASNDETTASESQMGGTGNSASANTDAGRAKAMTEGEEAAAGDSGDASAQLDKKKTSDDARVIAEGQFGEGAEGESDEALARRLMDGLLHDGLEEDHGFSDEDDFDDEILQSEITADAPAGLLDDGAEVADKTINLDVDKEAGQVVAKTPDGTQVPSPRDGLTTPGTAGGGGRGRGAVSSSPSKPSYASALQKKPSDWHLEFSLDSQPLSLETTVYGAIHRFETSAARGGSASNAASSRYIWGNVYTVKYKKVAGPVPRPDVEGTPEPRDAASAAIELPPSVKADTPYAKLLQLLAVLHDLNAGWREAHQSGIETPNELAGDAVTAPPPLQEAAFVNNKLTAKLNRQLEEPMIVVSSCLPAWSTELPKVFPFLFPFEARFSFLQSTAFGYARLITRWQSLHSRSQDNSSSSSLRMEDSFGFLARLQRQKVRISRSSLLPSAFKVLELYGSTSSVLEVEYFEEVGTGLGPTLEFYSLVSKEFARKDLELWRDDDAAGTDTVYVRSAKGLFPAPIDVDQLESAETRKRLHVFKILGQFVAKALLDSRIIDCNFSPIFLRAVLNQPMTASLNMLSAVDPGLARSLRSMQKMSADDVTSLALDFTMPGHPGVELHRGGRDESVDASNLDQYISEVLEANLDICIRPAVRAFRQGFNLIFPIAAMSSFTADELVMLFGNTDEDWSEATLMSSIKPDHGLNAESESFKDIVAIMSSFSVVERRDFLQWLTGSPKLPIGGFAGLHPQLTVVKRPHEAPLTADDYLPSVMTCVNYLKMPLYSSRDMMRRRLEIAMKEGSTSFHLS